MASKDPSIDQLALLMMAWVSMSMKLTRGSTSAKALADSRLTIQQIIALHILMFEPSGSLSTLTERLELSASATSHLIQRLVEQGFVARVEDPKDRRQKKLSLTAAGRKLVEKLMKARLGEFRESLAPLSAGLRADLKVVLERVVEEMSWVCGQPCVDTHTTIIKAAGPLGIETMLRETSQDSEET